MQKPQVQEFFDPHSHTFSYVVSDPKSKRCAIIDSVLDYDAASCTTSTVQADRIIAYVQAQHLHVDWILETHIHADHVTGAQYLKSKLGGQVATSHQVTRVQNTFAQIYQLDLQDFNVQQPFDHLFADHESFQIGDLNAYTLFTPGHTPACLSYVIEDTVFVGDTLFMPDYGTARCDFPEGSAEVLFDSVQSLYQLPSETRMFVCHDYLPEKRQDYLYVTDIKTQKQQNIHLHTGINKLDFVKLRQQRDAQLDMPKLMLVAIQLNIAAGHFPTPSTKGISYLKLPLNYFK
jgi:glyoxylase-like metal-dependent hydrolase (beta-lactamase superfamily II)